MKLDIILKKSKNNLDMVLKNFKYSELLNKKLVSLGLPSISINESDSINIDEYLNISNNDPRANLMSRFTPSHILCDIGNNYTNMKKFRFTYGAHTTNITAFYKNSIDFNKITMLGVKSLAFCNEKLNKSIVNLTYAPHPDKKLLLKNNIIGPSSINSGFTTHYFNGDKHITIFREEEAEKVLIHELVHYLGIDFSFMGNEQQLINKQFLEDFDVNTDYSNINTFEAYTDFIGILYNNIYNSIINNKNLREMMNNEVKFQKYQIHKLLSKYNMKHPLSELNNGKKIEQSTNVVSYYILKYGLTKDYEKTLSNYNLNTNWSKHKIHEFYNYAKNELKKETFYPKSKYFDSTMRMSYV